MEAITRTIYAFAWALADAPDRPRIDKPMPATVPNYRYAASSAVRPPRYRGHPSRGSPFITFSAFR